MSKTRESLQQDLQDNEQKLDLLKRQNTRLENRMRYLQTGDRKKRTHHLCNMGGAIQTLSPEADSRSKEQFFSLMEQIFALPEVQQLVSQAIFRSEVAQT